MKTGLQMIVTDHLPGPGVCWGLGDIPDHIITVIHGHMAAREWEGSEPKSPAALVWLRLRKHKPAVVSFGVVLTLTTACMAAPLIAPYAFDAIDLGAIRQTPSLSHWMGTDDLGRDLFTRILFGGRVSILIGILSAVIGTGL